MREVSRRALWRRLTTVRRRIRVRAVLETSYRRNGRGQWLKWEGLKGLVPAGLALLIHVFVVDIPAAVMNVLLIGGVGWMVFVGWNVGVVAFRLNRRHVAFDKAIGRERFLALLARREKR